MTDNQVKRPFKVNYNTWIAIMIVLDVMLGGCVHYYLKFLFPELDLVIPKMIYPYQDTPLILEYLVFIVYWPFAFAISGLYKQLRQKGFYQYLTLFISTSFACQMVLFFFFYTKNEFLFDFGFFHFFFYMYLLILTVFLIPRVLYYVFFYWGMKHRKLAIHALLIGNGQKAEMVYHELSGYKHLLNYCFTGYIATGGVNRSFVNQSIQCIGSIEELSDLIDQQHIDEVIVALDDNESDHIQKVLSIVKHKEIVIRLLPDISAILEGVVKMNHIKGIPMITIRNRFMPLWQVLVKTLFDYITSLIALLLSLPLWPIIIIGIKATSKGPVFYSQIRIGKNRRPFKMYKFRSMTASAESSGPALSSHNDPRITPFGKILRKWHLDEIPQFINVLKGDMSIVGPRPEREFFIQQILPIAPHYSHLFRIKPGITSWGMVRYGYAENIDQMVERLNYDILYLENISILVDLKIILHTLKSVFLGDGK